MLSRSTVEYTLDSFNTLSNKSSTEWFLASLQACIDGAWYWESSQNYNKIYISNSLKARLGYRQEDCVGETKNWWFQYVYPEDQEKLAEFWKDCLYNPATTRANLEFRVRHNNGHYLWLLLTSFLEKDRKKNLYGQGGLLQIYLLIVSYKLSWKIQLRRQNPFPKENQILLLLLITN